MNIRVDLNYPIKDGTEVVFRSPVDCSQVTGLIVYYNEDGNTASKEFAFADAHGNNLGDIDQLFAENVVVKVILDVTTSMAFVQNADTNAYLEEQFSDVVRYSEQDFDETKQKQARKNIGAIGNNLEGEALTGIGMLHFGTSPNNSMDVRVYTAENNDKQVKLIPLFGNVTLGGLSPGVDKNDVVTVEQLNNALADERPKEVYIGYDPGTGEVSSDLTYADALDLLADPVEIIAFLDISNGAHKATTQTIYRDEDRYVRFDFANLGIAELDSDGAWSFISNDDIVDDIITEYAKKKCVTPQMYGATGDGETDDTEAIQQCIYKNRNIFFPEGTYRITAPLKMPEGRTLSGGNQYNTMIFCDKCDGIHFEENAERIVIKDIAFREFKSPTEYQSAKANGFPDGRHKAFTFAKAVVHVVFDNVWTRYFSDTIFYANGVGFINNIYLQNSTFEYGGKNCIEFLNDTGDQINDIVIRNCNVTLFEEDGICVTGYNVSVETCSIQACRNGVRIDGDMSATGKSSHAKGVVIRNNYFEQIRQSYIWVNAHYDTKTAVHNYVSALTIMGNYGGAFKTLDTDENGNYYPAVRFTVTNPNNISLKAHKWDGRCLIGGVFYAANDFLTNSSQILIDGGSLLYNDSVIITDARFGNYAAETVYDVNGNISANVPYQLVNMASATIISRYIKYVDTLKLYEGFIPDGATVTNEKVVLPDGTSLYYNLVKKGVYRMAFTLEGTPTNASVTVYGYHKDGTKINLRTLKYNDAGEKSIGWDVFNNINAQSYKDFESYDIVFNSGDNGITIYNPVITYIN